jgi:hypothetical protein
MPTSSTRRLRLAEPDEPLPDDRARVARALLGPVNPVLDNEAYVIDDAEWREIRNDPRYLIGRLQQALTALLEREVPPLNATERLLAEAITDAIAYRKQARCPAGCGDICDRCRPDWDKAEAYEALYRSLGIIDELPRPLQGLSVVPS